MNIGNAIKEIRHAKGYSQKKLADKCGLSANALCAIERNTSFPSKESLAKICNALEIPEAYLMFYSVSEDEVDIEKRAAFKALKTVLIS